MGRDAVKCPGPLYSCRNMAAGIGRGCRNASPAIFLPGTGRAGMGWEAYIAKYP